MRIDLQLRVGVCVVGVIAASLALVWATGSHVETGVSETLIESPPLDPEPTELTIEGFGRNTVGGSRGTLYVVTNLNDSGPCSLRDLLNRPGPRIIKFAVSGTISLRSDLRLSEPFVTIDGSDAPNGGISIRGGSFLITAREVIVRHIRFREGDLGTTSSDAVFIGGDDGKRPSNVVLDHCSISWGDDGNLDIVNGASDVTVQWCILSENLGPGATLISYGATRITLHHNLYVNSGSNRNPATVGGEVDLVNNVIYRNFIGASFDNLNGFGPSPTQPIHVNVVGNFWKAGPDENTSNPHNRAIYLYAANPLSPQSGVYLQGNIGPSRLDEALPQANIAYSDGGSFPVGTTRYDYPQVRTTTPHQAYEDVLARAGATLPCRDAVDTRIVNYVTTAGGRTNSQNTDPSLVGGWPDLTQPCPDKRISIVTLRVLPGKCTAKY